MWSVRALSRVDWRIFPIVLCLMIMSLLVISSMTADPELDRLSFWTPFVKMQLRWFCLGWAVFFAMVGFDYRKFRIWSVPLYVFMILLLIGLFFVGSIQNVHRWYRIAGVASFQPSEQAKLILVLFLGWFLEKKGTTAGSLKAACQMGLLVGIPFLLILKQPDLGTALILYPIALSMGYFASMHKKVLRVLSFLGLMGLFVVLLLFLQVLSHEEMRPFFTSFIKDYQYERFHPETYHQKASQIAIALGGWTGSGWHRSEFSSRQWLPAAHTDSVFAAFGEEFGFVGLTFLLFLFYALIYCNAQVIAVARDPFGRFVAAGLTIYLAMHVLLNVGMMCALLPISGVPLIFITYGGSSLVTTMATLGILQSIYSRRFMF